LISSACVSGTFIHLGGDDTRLWNWLFRPLLWQLVTLR